jgi:hypothetical protein
MLTIYVPNPIARAEDYVVETYVKIVRSEFGALFEKYDDVRIRLARTIAGFLESKGEADGEMDKTVNSFHDEQIKREYQKQKGKTIDYTALFDEALDEALEDPHFPDKLAFWLSDGEFLAAIPSQDLEAKLGDYIQKVMSKDAGALYQQLYGSYSKIPKLEEFVRTGRRELLTAMARQFQYKPSRLLSPNFDLWTNLLAESGINDAYDLYIKMRESGKALPSQRVIRDLLLMKMAQHLSNPNDKRGIDKIREIYTNPKNSVYLDKNIWGKILNKFIDYTGEGSYHYKDGITRSHVIPFFHGLVSSEFKEMVSDNTYLQPYIKLSNWLERNA